MTVSVKTAQDITPSIATRITGLDELRGIAIILVMIAHFFELRKTVPLLKETHVGALGVDIFFMISGFLIGKILLESRDSANYFRKFYVRRAFRIAPLYLVLVSTVIAGCLAIGQDARSWPFYLSFTQNFLPTEDNLHASLFPQYASLPSLGPLWSLAVEEHFYSFMPLLVFFLPKCWLRIILILTAIGGIYFKHQATLNITREQWLCYTNPHETYFRMQYLAFGVLLNLPRGFASVTFLFTAWLGLALATGGKGTTAELALGYAGFLLIWSAVHSKLVIRNAFLAKLGVLCFGLYVLHMPIKIAMKLVQIHMTFLPTPIWLIAFLAVSICAANISYRYFELPIQRLRSRYEKSSRTHQPTPLSENA